MRMMGNDCFWQNSYNCSSDEISLYNTVLMPAFAMAALIANLQRVNASAVPPMLDGIDNIWAIS
ncbi:hypothetical protein swp_4669 [Shewanella piezotolerans WP3]|uniref:Uncharacterized protein n=1 Tax=Shewanella piezotolerans (strain WP3 / JCM 13877) TaxID=225849 RepID=B8CTR2_SHEPW|nr:hypothetical protein swp_4669 [Shewanella piezotolerans WP3]